MVDFACTEAKLAVELDGGQHQDQVAYDDVRAAYIEDCGWRILRFWNNDVLGNLEGVLAVITGTLNGPAEDDDRRRR